MNQLSDPLQTQWIEQLRKSQVKKISTLELQQLLKIEHYRLFATQVKQLEEIKVLKGIKPKETNGMTPPLCKQYEVLINKVEKQTVDYRHELQRLHPKISTTHYEKHQKYYEGYRKEIERISRFLKYCSDQERQQGKILPISVNERSFELFHNEKILDQLIKRGVIENLGLTLDDLYVYQTDESFFYFLPPHIPPFANVLIIENKDTYVTLQRLFRQKGVQQVLKIQEVEIHALIYGEGRKIEKSLSFTLDHIEPVFRHPQTTYYYAGDLDYVGIAIYLNLHSRYKETHRLEYLPNYFDLLIETFERKNSQRGREITWPTLKEKDKKHQPIEAKEYQLLIPNKRFHDIHDQLSQGYYLPQEVMSYVDWSHHLRPMEVTSCTNSTNKVSMK